MTIPTDARTNWRYTNEQITADLQTKFGVKAPLVLRTRTDSIRFEAFRLEFTDSRTLAANWEVRGKELGLAVNRALAHNIVEYVDHGSFGGASRWDHMEVLAALTVLPDEFATVYSSGDLAAQARQFELLMNRALFILRQRKDGGMIQHPKKYAGRHFANTLCIDLLNYCCSRGFINGSVRLTIGRLLSNSILTNYTIHSPIGQKYRPGVNDETVRAVAEQQLGRSVTISDVHEVIAFIFTLYSINTTRDQDWEAIQRFMDDDKTIDMPPSTLARSAQASTRNTQH